MEAWDCLAYLRGELEELADFVSQKTADLHLVLEEVESSLHHLVDSAGKTITNSEECLEMRAYREKELLPFKVECPKCGTKAIALQYQENYSPIDGENVEYLSCNCNICHHEWAMHCRNYKPPKKEIVD